MSEREPRCPICRVDLQGTFYEQAMIWACPDCAGTFMPLDQLHAITTNESEPRSWGEHVDAIDRASTKLPLLDHIRAPLACPWCDEQMHRAVFDGDSGIGIDSCDSCGVWLDPGELQRAEAWREARRAGLQGE